MKKTLIAVLVLMMAASVVLAENPTSKGHWMIAGSSNAGFAKGGGDLNKDGNGDTPSSFQFSPTLAYFLADGFAIGALAIFEKTTWGDVSTTGMHLGPMVAWFPTGKNVTEAKGAMLPFVTASFRIVSDKTTYKDGVGGLSKLARMRADDESKTSGWAARFTGGGMWMASSSVGLHGAAYFELQNAKFKSNFGGVKTESDSFSGSEFGILLGVTGFFGGGQ